MGCYDAMFHQKIKDYIKDHREDYIAFLQKLVQQPSTVGNELGAQQLLAERLKSQGCEVDIWEPDYSRLSQHPYFNSTRADFTGSPNVVSVIKGTGGGKSIILNGHVDVVPEGDRNTWTVEPYSGEIKDGKLYGRGSTDMKGGNLAILIAFEALCNLGIPLKGDVIFQSVIEEESGGSGTLACIERGYRADVALIPEPSEMRIFPKQQGSVWFRVTVDGQSAHGGTRYEGVSAIEKGWIVFNEIMKLEKRRNDRITDPMYADNPIPIPINIGRFDSGYFPSAVPDRAIIEGRYGIAPGETIDAAKQEFMQCMATLDQIDSWFTEHPVQVEWPGLRLPPGGIDLEHPFLGVLTQNFKNVTKEDPKMEGSTWGTDGGLLTTVADIPSVIFGPGTTHMAHFADEYVELDNIFECAEIIALSVIEWCGVRI